MNQKIIKRIKAIGKNVRFETMVKITNPECLSIGDDVLFMCGVYIQAGVEGIEIGSNTHFAPYAVLYGPLTIGSNVAVAAGGGVRQRGTGVFSYRYSDG